MLAIRRHLGNGERLGRIHKGRLATWSGYTLDADAGATLRSPINQLRERQMTLLSSKVRNLFRKYPDEFLREYRGCSDLDCILGCNISNAHCERIAIAYASWRAEHSSALSSPARGNAT